MGVRERKVEKHLDSEITNLGGITRKWVCPGRDGVTDRIVIYKGDVYLVEVKTIEGTLSTAQVREHQRLIDAGAKVFTVYGEEGIDCWIREVLF